VLLLLLLLHLLAGRTECEFIFPAVKICVPCRCGGIYAVPAQSVSSERTTCVLSLAVTSSFVSGPAECQLMDMMQQCSS
jgi:hypothetical protein